MLPKSLSSFLSEFSSDPIKVIDMSIDLKDYVSMDLSSSNLDLQNFDVSSSEAWQHYIDSNLKKRNAKVAYGGYLEERSIYNRSSYFKNKDLSNERNIHLGIDLWIAEGTHVLAAFDGEIHSYKNNTNFGDYGPTIILKHNIEGSVFYTLYGHLSLDAIENLKVGQKVNRGQIIAQLGTATVNGDYAPHLHFQIIKDIQGGFGDYPGVCSKQGLGFYKQNCPDPNLILKLY
jgi:murein DD-endopeptidase MepM/ murein hydrolase activator NlpD